LSEPEKEIARYFWRLWARDAQLPPSRESWLQAEKTVKWIAEWEKKHPNETFTDSWRTWLFLAGRGSGKTRAGAEWVRTQIEEFGVGRMALVAPTASDVRDTMVEGESGILAHSPPWNMPQYISSKRKLEWPNGATAHMYSAEEGDRLRGPQHEKAWCDELTSWGDPETWDMLLFGLRIGNLPQVLVTTTSKIGHKLLKGIIKDPYTYMTNGHTFDNADNLHSQFIEHIKKKYEGTRLGRQELEGKYIEEGIGVLWNEDSFQYLPTRPDDALNRVIVAVDPSISDTAEGAETGIVVVGRDEENNGYVLADHSGHYSPNGWAAKAIDLYKMYKANAIVAETNNGGDMVISTIKNVDPGVKTKKVVATRGKRIRAEPISMLYEQNRVWHVGHYPQLEEQMVDFNPEDTKMASPDRVDALVWGLTELIITPSEVRFRRI
jgi:phage terminase large subunit-like protein